MRRLASGMAAYALIALGFAVSTLNAYLLGRVRSNLRVSSGADLVRLQSVQHTAVAGILGGIAILVLGHMLLHRSASGVRSEASH